METLLWIITGASAIYTIYAIQKNSPSSRINQLEELGYKEYYKAIKYEEKEIEELSNDKKFKVFNKEMIRMSKEKLEELKEFERKFVHLKEKTRHKPAREKLEIFTDWYEYNKGINYLNQAREDTINDVSGTLRKIHVKEIEHYQIKFAEIQRRYATKLKA